MCRPSPAVSAQYGFAKGVGPVRAHVIRIRPRYPSFMEPAAIETRHLTFLFADVEGSTRLMERHGTDAGVALSRYHELVVTTTGRHGGREIGRASCRERV